MDPGTAGCGAGQRLSMGPHIYVDADACPVKAETIKVAERHGLPVIFVANSWLKHPTRAQGAHAGRVRVIRRG